MSITTLPILPAATVIAVRDRPGQPPELLMLRRHAAMAFADAWVFPGGRVDDGDRAIADRLRTTTTIEDADDLAARIAAIRETIEEAGLAVGLDPAPDVETLASLRVRLLRGGDFAALLDEAGLTLRPEALVPYARWQPPAHAPRRFDTRFYLVEVRGDAVVSADGRESIDIGWVTATDMLARAEAGEAKLVFPTRANLRRLALGDDFSALVEAAAAVAVELIVTRAEPCEGGVRLSIAERHGYPDVAMVVPRA